MYVPVVIEQEGKGERSYDLFSRLLKDRIVRIDGEITAAIIEAKDGMELTEEEVNEFCLGMARYKRPKKIIFTTIPRNATGKIEKPKLRKIYKSENLVAAENNA